MSEERAKLRLEEAKKESRLRAEMEGTLELKDRQLTEVMERMRRLEENLYEAKKEVPGSLHLPFHVRSNYTVGRPLIRDVLFCCLTEVPVTNWAAQ